MSNSRGSWYSPGGRRFQGNRGRLTSSLPPPPDLKGRAIVRYYKNLNKEYQKKNVVINLTIPSAIISAINKNLMFIETIAKMENIELPFTNIFESLMKPKTESIKRKESPHPEEYDVADKRYKEGTNISLKNVLVPTDTYVNENEKILLNLKAEIHNIVRDEPSTLSTLYDILIKTEPSSLSTLNDIPIKTEPSSVSMPDYIPINSESCSLSTPNNKPFKSEPSSLSTLNDIPIKTEPSSVSMADYIPIKSESCSLSAPNNKPSEPSSLSTLNDILIKTEPSSVSIPDYIPINSESCSLSTPNNKPFKSEPSSLSTLNDIPIKTEPSSVSMADYIPIKSESCSLSAPNNKPSEPSSLSTLNDILIKTEPSSVSMPDYIPINSESCSLSTPNNKPFKSEPSSLSTLNDILIKTEPSSVSMPDYIPINSESCSLSTPNNKPFKSEPSSLSTLNDIPIKTEPSSVSLSDYIPIKDEPSSLSIPDCIPFKNENIMNDCFNSERILGIRVRHYKYGYQDIITGTFDEKLEEALTQGIQITSDNDVVRKLNHDYYKEYNEMVGKLSYNKMLQFRENLPAYKKKENILDNIDKSQVLVISGETGCGKSTQIPQLILDRAMNNMTGANVRILVTQPRRIAASSLAMRVAKERAEMLGISVGYSVRLEKVESRPRGSIIFCTTGVLLTELEVNQALSNYSHIILDEVHERDTNVDLAMAVLKQILKKRKDLKLILMSATLDAEALSTYFDNCPVVFIEGLAYPVTDVYLEDILKLTHYQIQKEVLKKHKKQKWKKFEKKVQSREANELEQYIKHNAEIGPWLESIKNNIPLDVYKTLKDPEIEAFNIDLIVVLLKYICNGEPGAILVFLPGIGEITKVMRCMELSGLFNERHEIYPLHSKLATLEQHKIFMRPPLGVRKIILATNIAETSITIDDIVYVVDCGRIKVSGLNVEQNISTLKTEWVSKANLHQRRGRAGRCQPGICYCLLTSYRAEKLADRLLPELQRSNLLEPVLMVKKLRLGLAYTALQTVPSPPAEKTVESAVRHLQKCGALYKTETLTPLGWHLARLPVHPAAGKLLLFGALFGCLDRAASVAAVWSYKDPFLFVIGKEFEIKAVKRRLAMGEPSDHVAMSEAIMQWESCSYRDRRSFAYDHFLSNNTLELLVDMKKQLGENLTQMGFLSSSDLHAQWENRNWNNMSLFKAIVAAALYPNVAQVRWRNLKSVKKHTSIKAVCPVDGKVRIHKSSVMTCLHGTQRREGICTNPGANWLVYWLKQRMSDLFLIDVNLVYTLPLLFFGEFSVKEDLENPEDCLMSITKTINVRCNKNSANTILKLRILLDKVLANKVMETCPHSVKQSQFEDEVLKTVIELITAEDEQADYIEDDVSEASDDNGH